MKDHAVNLFDLEQAKLLSYKLSCGNSLGMDWDAAAMPRPRAQRPAAREVAPRSTASEYPPQIVEPPPELDGWEPLIRWSLAQFGADSGFAVDTQGFVIATAGQLANDGFEGMGAELCYAMEQLERVDPNAGGLVWVDLEFHRRRIVCLRVSLEDKNPMILGFVGAGTGYIDIRSQVEHIVLDAMAHFE